VREQGYAIDNEESIVGLRCVAAPILDDRNRTVAALSASGSAAEFTAETTPAIIEAVRAAARTVSNRLGHRVQERQELEELAPT
jgi:IclR family acetate operon transcriptional repressor